MKGAVVGGEAGGVMAGEHVVERRGQSRPSLFLLSGDATRVGRSKQLEFPGQSTRVECAGSRCAVRCVQDLCSLQLMRRKEL